MFQRNTYPWCIFILKLNIIILFLKEKLYKLMRIEKWKKGVQETGRVGKGYFVSWKEFWMIETQSLDGLLISHVNLASHLIYLSHVISIKFSLKSYSMATIFLYKKISWYSLYFTSLSWSRTESLHMSGVLKKNIYWAFKLRDLEIMLIVRVLQT